MLVTERNGAHLEATTVYGALRGNHSNNCVVYVCICVCVSVRACVCVDLRCIKLYFTHVQQITIFQATYTVAIWENVLQLGKEYILNFIFIKETRRSMQHTY